MRRFELGDRFWGVNFKGNDLLILSGKVGSNGKTGLKKFGKLADAEAEAERLIAGKLKEGYEEVGGDAPAKKASPAPASKAKKEKAAPKTEEPEPAPAAKAKTKAASSSFEERVTPDPDAVEKSKPEPLPKEDKCLEEIAKHFAEKTWNQYTHLSELKDGIKKSKGRNKELMEEILATYAVGKAPKDLDVDVSAAELHMVPTEWIVPYLYSRGGLTHVVKAFLKGLDFVQSSTGGQGGSWVSLENHEPEIKSWLPLTNVATRGYGNAAIATLLEIAPKKDVEAARAEATKARGEPLPVRILLSLAF